MDKCVYNKVVDNDCLIISLYVDHMFIIGTSLEIIDSTKCFLTLKWRIWGSILSVKIISRDDSIMLSQAHYVDYWETSEEVW